ncbi:hypothetical protein M1O16_03585 [Dehalococcoidia bacterium]|nr:hypothetical protein [Dehalococcoidia bacterium]
MKGMWYLILKTKTHDPGKHAWSYSTRSVDYENWAKLIACRVIDPGDDGQNFQQFMSDSPWSAGAVFQAEVRPELRGGMLTLNESGDKKAGGQSAGVARQYWGTFPPKSQLEALRAKSNGLPFHVVGCF